MCSVAEFTNIGCVVNKEQNSQDEQFVGPLLSTHRQACVVPNTQWSQYADAVRLNNVLAALEQATWSGMSKGEIARL